MWLEELLAACGFSKFEELLAVCGVPKREQAAVAKEFSRHLDKQAEIMKVVCDVLGEKYEKPMTVAEINDAFGSEYVINRLRETLSEDDFAEFNSIQRIFDDFVRRHEPL